MILIVVAVVVTLLIVVASLAAVAAPALLRMRKKGNQAAAAAAGRNLSNAMMEFQMEYGSFPDDETAKLVGPKSPYPYVLSGPHSNDYLRQLIAAGLVKSEDPFFIRGMFGRDRPDNRMENGHALEPGEVGWGYVMDGNKAISSESYAAPLLVAPLMPDGPPGTCNPKLFNKHAPVICVDGSVKDLWISPDGHLRIKDGKLLLETGPGTVWPAGVTPVIRPPAAP
ncbi:MAG: hypothetical protein J0M04_14755 [Verrucomicrobia bacterium]|nr:hypothetical protein [Verrucomicrobiota bacterium]